MNRYTSHACNLAKRPVEQKHVVPKYVIVPKFRCAKNESTAKHRNQRIKSNEIEVLVGMKAFQVSPKMHHNEYSSWKGADTARNNFGLFLWSQKSHLFKISYG